MLHRAGRWVVRILLCHKLVEILAKIWPDSLLSSKFKKISAWWSTIPKFRRHVATNIFVGLAIAAALHLFHGSSLLHETEDAGIDWMIQMNRGVVESSDTGYAFLDIDEKTYRHWDEPFYTPRADLLKIIEYATSANPRLVFVDIELANIGHDPVADRSIERFIADYPTTAAPLVLVRTFREKLEAPERVEQRSSFLDEIVTTKANVFWASTLFLREADHSIRRWNLWTGAENGQTVIEAVPSVQLLATAISQKPSSSPQSIYQEIVDKLTPYVSGQNSSIGTLDLAGLTISLKPTPLQQRIIYAFPAKYPKGTRPPSINTTSGIRPLIIQRSVMPIVVSPQPIDNSWLKDRIAVVGASYADSRDIHSTPLGDMPGAMILVNAIHSLSQHGEIEPPATWVKVLVEIILITVMSFAFAWLSTFWGMVLSGLFVVIVLLPLSFMFFKHGVWLDFAIPLLGVQLHEMAATFEDNLHKRKQSVSH